MIIENNSKEYLNVYLRTRKKNCTIPDHIHTNYEFVYFFSGEGTIIFDKEEHKFKQGTYYIMRPGTIHSEHHEITGTSLVVWFQPPKDVEIQNFIQNDQKLNLLPEVLRIKNEIERQAYGYKEMVDLLTKEISLSISRQQHTKKSDYIHDIQGSIDYIDEYFMTQIKISELANDCSYCEDHFRILFKERTGLNPKDYILNKRIDYAKKLLLMDEYEISEIYNLCGFKSYSQFMTFFKEQTGISPKKYRDSNLKGITI